MRYEKIVCSSVKQLADALQALKDDGVLWRNGEYIGNDTTKEAEGLFEHRYHNGAPISRDFDSIVLLHKDLGRSSYHDAGGENAILCWSGRLSEDVKE